MPNYRKSHGAILDQNNNVIAETLMCPHCGLPFIKRFDPKKFKLVNLAGHVRSVCFKCGGEVCGKQECNMRCTPIERQIEEAEKGIII